MSEAHKQCGLDISRWAGLVFSCFGPTSVLVIGSEVSGYIFALAEHGLQASGFERDPVTGKYQPVHRQNSRRVAPEQAGWDTLVFEQEALEDFLAFSATAFEDQFGKPERVLILVSPVTGGSYLLDAAAWLWNLGYHRSFLEDSWLEEGCFTCLFERAFDHPAKALASYEAEWWRLTQLSQKRREITREYMDELLLTLAGFQQKNQSFASGANEYEIRWNAFQNSRTGKILNLLSKIRRKIKFL